MTPDDDVIDAEYTESPTQALVPVERFELVEIVDGCADCGRPLLLGDAIVDERRAADRQMLCATCHQAWLDQVPADIFASLRSALVRARRAGLPATLTKEQWQATLAHFGNRCAYCDGPWSLLEHATAITLGGGTTADNCLPACAVCNTRKRDTQIEHLKWPLVSRALAWLREQGRPTKGR